MTNRKDGPLEIYVHIPFCIRKCLYCDFLSGPAEHNTQTLYIEALINEIRCAQEEAGRPVSSIFIGGGTPSVLPGEDICEIMKELRRRFVVLEDAEISIEINPGTLNKEKLEAYRRVGINRLSIGLQSVRDAELKLLGRIHTMEEFLESYQMAVQAGFQNINVDLMFALPKQKVENWEENLRTVAQLNPAPAHISAYSLIVEEGTPFGCMTEAELALPSEDEEYRMYDLTEKVLREYGYHQYEISNYAKSGMECRHNCGYWQRKDYLGFGLGAASLIRNTRFRNPFRMEDYMDRISRHESCPEEMEVLTRKEQMEEFMFLGLRMMEGVSKQRFQKEFEISMQEVYGEVIQKFTKQGLLIEETDLLYLSREGIHVSNSIMAEFLLDA
ncbi:MAG: oxygen-independent coproporphyrinogen III oxidase [Blautia sp.]|nr:oxygen-independent coproporphyrinogen III oxidase [Blautia sp.]